MQKYLSDCIEKIQQKDVFWLDQWGNREESEIYVNMLWSFWHEHGYFEVVINVTEIYL
jgi:hypothetical protein